MCYSKTWRSRSQKILGRLKEILSPGPAFINPFTTSLVKIPTRTINREVKLNLPSKEGLNVNAEISILYHVKQEKTIDIINEVGSILKEF